MRTPKTRRSARCLRISHAVGVLLASALAGPACGGSEGPDDNNVLQTRPVINVAAGERLIADGGTVLVSPYGNGKTTLWVSNAGDAPLVIEAVALSADSHASLSIVAADLPATLQPLDSSARWGVDIAVTGDADGAALGELLITTNHQLDGSTTFRAQIQVETSPPQIVVPALADLGTVASGTSVEHAISITNAGLAPLAVSRLTLDAPAAFDWAQSATAGEATRVGRDLVFDPVWEIAPGANEQVRVVYSGTDPAPASGDVRIFSNDPFTPEALIALQANVGGPCIALSSTSLDFGGKYVGAAATAELSITSCGDEALIIDEMGWADGASSAFTAPFHELEFPLALPVNKTLTLPVTFIPEAVAAIEGGAPVLEAALLVVKANTAVPERQIGISGWGVDTLCPTPIISVAEGEEVIPQTLLHLDGSQSFAAQGAVDTYVWEVTGPQGDVGIFLPSSGSPQPTFRANLVGVYAFSLKVRDASGQWTDGSNGCMPATFSVAVVSDELLHVELLWHTPGDADETDVGPEAGADLDLHFLHPFAFADGGAGWFHPMFDTFWLNPSPNWNNFSDSLDDPGLDRDDTDGGGPENMNLDVMETGVTYRVGVHYWNDHKFGVSEATVRIYLHSTLVFERSGVSMWDGDLWNVADIAWPSGQVTSNSLPGDVPNIIANYPVP